MSYSVIWLPAAVEDLTRLRRFIVEKNPTAATRAVARIKEAVNLLIDNPQAGRPVEDLFPFRDLFVPFGQGNYVLRYCIEDRCVVMVRVWHSKEDRATQE